MYTLFKFACVGVVNTLIDLAALNALLLVFGAGFHGELFVFFKSISFLAAVGNSYVLNKFWVFQDEGAIHDDREPLSFLIVSLFGFLANVSVSFAVFSAVVTVLSDSLSANIGAIAGTIAVFLWNFFGYRTFVFKHRKTV